MIICRVCITHLIITAILKGKGAVETVEDQCGPINGLSLGQVIFALNQTLEEQENLRY